MPRYGQWRDDVIQFLVHANEETMHADMLAKRIVELGGTADFSPDSLSRRSHATCDESRELKVMISANLVAERIAIETCSQMIGLIGEKDSTTRRLVEESWPSSRHTRRN
jgi:bacterioferritin